MNTEKIFRFLGRKAGNAYNKGRWYYRSLFGSEDEVIRAESLVGRELAKKYLDEAAIISDPAVNQHLKQLGNQLTNRLTQEDRHFHYYLVEAEDVNAFAIPGGYIFVTTALMQQYRGQDSELAFILGHEIGHIVKGHAFQRTMANTSVQVLNRLLRTGSVVGGFAKQTLAKMLQSGYSQEQELEADWFGARLMHSAGFSQDFAVKSLQRLSQHAGSPSAFESYFTTHPGIDERIKQLQERIKS